MKKNKNRNKEKKNKKSNYIGQQIVGKVRLHKNGFGFLVPEESEETKKVGSGEYQVVVEKPQDIYLGKKQLKGIMDGDTLLVKTEKKRDNEDLLRGRVVKVVKRQHKFIVGTFLEYEKFAFVEPVKKEFVEDVFISKKNFNKARDEDIVLVEIIQYGDKKGKAEGKVTEIIAKKDDPARDIKALVVNSGREISFSNDVKKEAKKIEDYQITQEEISKREDLRDKYIVTIDGSYSKDFDDAISLEKLENGNCLLGVHIADVAHFVTEKTHIDKEARKRANSIYLVNQVIPMLPEVLSNNLCSLVPGKDRLTVSCDMEIDDKGKVVNYKIYESVINSKRRYTYDEVYEIIKETEAPKSGEIRFTNQDESFEFKKIEEMLQLEKILKKARESRGSIEFETGEPHITLGPDGVPTDIFKEERNTAHEVIEEFMLKANETVAEHFFWISTPFVYRNHPEPKVEKMEQIKEYLKGFGIKIRGSVSDIKPYMINDAIKDGRGTKYQFIVERAVLKSMEKALYEEECTGHFGLSLERYCHFTSPIRRYPDLMVHRIIKKFLHQGVESLGNSKLKKECEKISRWASEVEKTTVELERDVEKMKIAEYMEKEVGKRYKGVVSGVSNYGIYVEIKDCIEGMVRVSDIEGDIYILDKENHRVVGVNSKKSISLGDRVEIEVLDANKETREIDFELIEE